MSGVVRTGGVLLATLPPLPTDQALRELANSVLVEVDRGGECRLVVDASKLEVVDVFFAEGLVQLARSAQILGCEVALAGVPAGAALVLSALGSDLAGVRAFRSVEHALNAPD